MRYTVLLSLDALADYEKHRKSGDKQVLKKIKSLLLELEEHPKFGTGKPEQLRENLTGSWSRRINEKHRLIYKIEEKKVIVMILSMYGHYNDK